jgi:glyoxylase-like metal-dependent hydrolase (beta-lactamase superfamily II)
VDIQIGAANWEVVGTPGHTPGHLCLADESQRILIAGDHVLPTVYPGIGLGEGNQANPVEEYIRSLDRLHSYDDYLIVPGHGYCFRGLRQRRSSIRGHVLRRAAQVAHAAETERGLSVFETASRLVWGGGWERLRSSVLLVSALKQTEFYLEFISRGGLEKTGLEMSAPAGQHRA